MFPWPSHIIITSHHMVPEGLTPKSRIWHYIDSFPLVHLRCIYSFKLFVCPSLYHFPQLTCLYPMMTCEASWSPWLYSPTPSMCHTRDVICDGCFLSSEKMTPIKIHVLSKVQPFLSCTIKQCQYCTFPLAGVESTVTLEHSNECDM